MTELQLSLLERVKKELGASGDLDSLSLYDLLYDERSKNHPDKFQDERIKKQAEDRFKVLNNLLKELEFYIEQEKFTKKASEIVLYQDKYQILTVKKDVLNLEKRIEDLQIENRVLTRDKEALEKALQVKEEKDLVDAHTDLINLYTPKKSNLIALSVTAFLLIVINLITHLNSIKEKIAFISPFDPKYISYMLFSVLVIVILDRLIQQRNFARVKRISDELTSPDTIREFHDRYRREKDAPYTRDYFMEADVTAFIKDRYGRRRYRKSLIYYIEGLFIIRAPKSFNYLKDIFIYNLINKKLVDIGNSKELDREFRIK